MSDTMNNIIDLQARQGNVEVVGVVIEKEDSREFNKFGKTGKVANAVLKDETGKIKLTLWNDDVDKISVGDKIHIKNGYVNEWQGEKQLTTGRLGSMEIVGKEEVKKDDEPKEEVYTNFDEEELSEEPLDDNEEVTDDDIGE